MGRVIVGRVIVGRVNGNPVTQPSSNQGSVTGTVTHNPPVNC